MNTKLVGMQIKTSKEVRAYAKIAAKKLGFSSVSEMILTQLAKANDSKLKTLIEKDLKEGSKPGRPWDKD